MALPASDDFERAGPGLGANWTFIEGSDITIVGSSDAGTSSGNGQEVWWNADSFPDDQYSEIVLTNVDGEQGPICRANTGGTYSRYGAMAQGTGGYNALEIINGGSWSHLSDFSSPPASTDTLRIEAEGTTIRAKINGTQVASVTNGTHTTGACGFGYWDSAGTARTESWEAGALGGGGPATALVDLIGCGLIPFPR
jgi:hypothetical protein